MKELRLNLTSSSAPKYQQLADAIRSAIRQGRVRPGEALPSSRELARRYSMDRHTVMNAIGELEAEGWVRAHEKRHYEVNETLPSAFLRPQSTLQKQIAVQQTSYRFARSSRVGEYIPVSRFGHSFPSGFPDLRLFPMKEFKSHFYDALRSRKSLGYGDPAGDEGLISQIEMYLRRVRNIDNREVIITHGSQEAIFFLAQLLIQPGDSVAIEALGYPPAAEALKFAGAKLIAIPVDADGLCVDRLEKILAKTRIRLLYVTPLHQYPTTVTLTASRRLKLYELACKHDFLILEDDYDNEFHYVSQPVAPLASFDPAGRILYVSTLSKVLFPSARLGFMSVPKPVALEVARLKRISSRQNEQLLQVAIGRWMKSGGFEKHLRKMRRTYEERCDSMHETLLAIQRSHPQISWRKPDGGMALWLNTAGDSAKLAERAARAGILVMPEANFRMDGGPGTHLRLGFSAQTPAENKAGLQKVSGYF